MELRREAEAATNSPTTRADDGADWEVKRGELEYCKMKQKRIKMLLADDIVHQILDWLPVISLLRFKLACRRWRALIESSYFIKQHLHLHHYDPNMKDKNHSLIYLLQSKDSPITFSLTPVEGFELPNVCLQLNYSDLHGYFPTSVLTIVSYNGIVCLNIFNHKRGQNICLWNPATKQSKLLPQSPTLSKVMTFDGFGFGFDVKNNDYKVVNLISSGDPLEKKVEVYSLSTSSWRSVTTVFPFRHFFRNPRMPFNNGTSFFWLGCNYHILLGHNSPKNTGIICFDFCSETFRSIALPYADHFPLSYYTRLVSVVHDKIACISKRKYWQEEIWLFNEYGTVNESWIKHYVVDINSIIDGPISIMTVSMDGQYIFFKRMGHMCRFNVVTKEINCFSLENFPCSSFDMNMVEFKESLVSVDGRGNAPIFISKDNGNQLMLQED